MDRKLLDRLATEALPIIEAHRRRADDPEYFQRAALALLTIQKASDALFLARHVLDEVKFDATHLANINLGMASSGRTFAEHEQRIDDARSYLFDLQLAIAAATQLDLTKAIQKPKTSNLKSLLKFVAELPKRVHPQYVAETLDLMRFWEEKTGTKVVSPKGYDANTQEALQDSIEFMRLCLHQIDDSIDTAKTITIVRNARLYDLEIRRLISEALTSPSAEDA